MRFGLESLELALVIANAFFGLCADRLGDLELLDQQEVGHEE